MLVVNPPSRTYVALGFGLSSSAPTVVSAKRSFVANGRRVSPRFVCSRISRLTSDERLLFDRWMVAIELAHAEEISAIIQRATKRLMIGLMERELAAALAEAIRVEIDEEIIKGLPRTP